MLVVITDLVKRDIDGGIAIGKENCQFIIDARYFDGESSILREIEHFS